MRATPITFSVFVGAPGTAIIQTERAEGLALVDLSGTASHFVLATLVHIRAGPRRFWATLRRCRRDRVIVEPTAGCGGRGSRTGEWTDCHDRAQRCGEGCHGVERALSHTKLLSGPRLDRTDATESDNTLWGVGEQGGLRKKADHG
jgi:hypothetical protein